MTNGRDRAISLLPGVMDRYFGAQSVCWWCCLFQPRSKTEFSPPAPPCPKGIHRSYSSGDYKAGNGFVDQLTAGSQPVVTIGSDLQASPPSVCRKFISMKENHRDNGTVHSVGTYACKHLICVRTFHFIVNYIEKILISSLFFLDS